MSAHGVIPQESPEGWVTAADYPKGALNRHSAGITQFRLEVSSDGAVSDCVIVASAGDPSLDQAGCQLLRARAHFSPATDDTGKAISSSYTSAIEWALPTAREIQPAKDRQTDDAIPEPMRYETGEDLMRDEMKWFSGTLGNQPIAGELVVRDGKVILSAHYSYARIGTPIHLTVTQQGNKINFAEGAAHMALILKSGPTSSNDTPFADAAGMAGTWESQSKSLPVSVDFMGIGMGDDSDFYPDQYPLSGMFFRPDAKTLNECLERPKLSPNQVDKCVEDATDHCNLDQLHLNFCDAALRQEMDALVKKRIAQAGGRSALTLRAYVKWAQLQQRKCAKDSSFSSDGSGFRADVDACVGGATMRLLAGSLDTKQVN